MNNRIIKSYLDNYLNSFGIVEKNETVAFEHFSNYCVFSHINPEAYDSDKFFHEEVHTGDEGDKAIDGIMILVNDVAVTSVEQFETVIGLSKPFSVKLIFVQAKTSAAFDSGEILKMGSGIKSFFKKGQLNANAAVLRYKEVADAIFDKSLRFLSNPECLIYYVSLGKWMEDANLKDTIEDVSGQLRALNIFSDVRFNTVDAERLATIYRELNNSISREIIIAKNVAFPAEIHGIQEAYLALVRMSEYMKLVTDQDGGLQAGLFYENVRGFLGENPVNKEIRETLEREESIQFPILNNGITIVTKSLRQSGEKFVLTDFQIVNGCQTTNVLYQCRNKVSSEMMVPLKIISTDNGELINRIIRSTNRQTQVLDEAFESLKEFHKRLQQYYDTFTHPDRIYYERRVHEYDNGTGIRKSNIVTLPIQLYAVISMFYGEPHSVHRYYGELLKANANRVFQENHQLSLYYASTWTLHQIESAMRRGDIRPDWKPYRYHLLFLIQIYVRTCKKMPKLPWFNSKDMDRLANSIIDAVSQPKQLGALLRYLTGVLSEAIQASPKKSFNGNSLTRIKDFTNDIEARLIAKMQE